MGKHRPSESQRREIVEQMTRDTIEHEKRLGRKPDERKIRKENEEIARDVDRERGWN